MLPKKLGFFIPVILLSACIFIITPGTLSAQTDSIPQEVVEEAMQAQGKDKSLLDVYLQGGWMMHVIALCSLGTIAVSVYCALQIKKDKLAPKLLVGQLNHLMANRDIQGAFDVCRSNPGALSKVLASSLVKANLERDMFNKKSMEEAAEHAVEAEEVKQMVWVNYLNVFATIAPMIGLLGTVTGMIEAFDQLSAGLSEPEDLAGGIGQAMVTTAGGLLVGIPAMFFYFFFRNILLTAITHLQDTVFKMFDLFTGEVNMDA
ncbi:MAG: MotA/TolQ/ExbB proton channel family protein [Verrucomicrobiota bacterium]